jgi:hypothetical protein
MREQSQRRCMGVTFERACLGGSASDAQSAVRARDAQMPPPVHNLQARV